MVCSFVKYAVRKELHKALFERKEPNNHITSISILNLDLFLPIFLDFDYKKSKFIRFLYNF